PRAPRRVLLARRRHLRGRLGPTTSGCPAMGEQLDELAAADVLVARDVRPREAAAQPSGDGGDGGLAVSVIARLPLVMLAVQLDERLELRPFDVNSRRTASSHNFRARFGS